MYECNTKNARRYIWTRARGALDKNFFRLNDQKRSQQQTGEKKTVTQPTRSKKIKLTFCKTGSYTFVSVLSRSDTKWHSSGISDAFAFLDSSRLQNHIQNLSRLYQKMSLTRKAEFLNFNIVHGIWPFNAQWFMKLRFCRQFTFIDSRTKYLFKNVFVIPIMVTKNAHVNIIFEFQVV